MYKLGVYGNHLFSRYNPTANEWQLAELQQSGFNYVVLSLLHVNPDASLVYNSTFIVQDGVFVNFPYLPDLLAKLKSTGSVKRVLFSIGGSGSDDFTNIGNLLNTADGKTALIQSISALQSALPIDGFDFDDEEGTIDANTLAEFGAILAAPNNFGGLFTTYCPAFLTQEDQWNEALVQAFKVEQGRNQPLSVEWWNLQCYAGGSGNDPVSWGDNLPKNAGVEDRRAFIVPGFSGTQDPASIRSTFAQFAGKGIGGGFIYTFENMLPTYSARNYAEAIVEGLESKKR